MIDEEKLAAFIDGSASDKETEEVLRDLTLSEESSEEWRQCQVAASLAGTTPARAADLDRARAFVSKQKVHKFPVFRTISIVMAIAASMLVVALVVVPRWNAKEPMYAENGKDIPTSDEQIAGQAPADTPALTPQVISGEPEPAPQSGSVIEDNVSTAAPSVVIRRELEMIRPSKDIYSVRVSHPERHFVFRWQTSGAEYSEIILLDAEGNLIAKDKGETLTEMSIEAGKLLSYGEVHWRVKTVFEGGDSSQKTGVVTFTKAE